jgi:1,4-alpha-glucan branching enzyme
VLKKQKTRNKDKVRVTFSLERPEAESVRVLGDFNQWTDAMDMKKKQAGRWEAAVELDPGREYQFRYLVNERDWVNDPEADGYAPNQHGSDNSIVRTRRNFTFFRQKSLLL